MAETNERMKQMTNLYQKANGELRSRHHSEFTEILNGLYVAEGLVVRTRRSKAQIWAEKVAAAKEIIAEDELSK